MERVAKELVGSSYYNTTLRLETLTKRKLANTKTSISFGNEKLNYISDAMETQQAGGMAATPAERAAQAVRIKGMKAALTLTNFSLGDEVPVYSSVQQDAMNAVQWKGAGRVKMAQDVMDAVKRSSLHFGNEKPVWKSVSHEAMEFEGNTNDFQKLKEDTVKLTAALRKHNFSFGEEPIEYVSDQTRGYGSVPLGAYRQRQDALPKIKETIQDSRSCHFSLGLDKVRREPTPPPPIHIIRRLPFTRPLCVTLPSLPHSPRCATSPSCTRACATATARVRRPMCRRGWSGPRP